MTDMDKAIEEARAAVLPFESWERLPGESGLTYSAFRAFRDYGPERNIRKAVERQFRKAEGHDAKIEAAIARKYRVFSDATQAATLLVQSIPPAGAGGGL
jgi:hypothetical protein